MNKALILACVALCAAFAARAGELCISCEQPAATYRCTVEQVSEKHKIGGSIEQEMCAKVLAKNGPHAKCQVTAVPQGGKCEGAERVVTLTDFQRAIGSSTESTYEVGALEKARKNVHDTWQCVLSLFKDC